MYFSIFIFTLWIFLAWFRLKKYNKYCNKQFTEKDEEFLKISKPQNLTTYNKDHHKSNHYENNTGDPQIINYVHDGPEIWYKFFWAEYDYNSSLLVKPILKEFYTFNSIKVWWIGHATTLIQFGDQFALTDPVFDDYASPFSFLITRKTKTPCLIKDLPQISYVFLSHDHWDHLSATSLIEIEKNSPNVIFFAPLGLSNLIQSWVKYVIEFDWRQTLIINNLKITCFPSRHSSNRYGLDFRYRLWCSWLFEYNNISIYFGGDSGIGPHFQEIIDYLNRPLDLSLLPLGPQEPKEVCRAVHLNPKDFINMSNILKSIITIPIHWGTFALGLKPKESDINKLKRKWNLNNQLIILNVGGMVEWNGNKFILKK